MKIEVHLTDEYVRELIDGAYISYWAEVLQYNRKTMRLKLKEEDGTVRVITKKDILAGFNTMYKDPDAAWHLANILREATDMYTGDAIVQMAAFGELKYG